MKNNYSALNKADLIKKIEELKLENTRIQEKNGEELSSIGKLKSVKKKPRKIKQSDMEDSINNYLINPESLPIGFAILNSKGLIKNLNSNAARLLNTKKDKAIDSPFTNFIGSSNKRKFTELFQNSKTNFKRESLEFLLGNNTKNTNSKEINYISVTICPFEEKSTNKIFFMLYIFDITSRYKKEKLLTESQERFKNMANNSPVMIWMTDADNRLEYMNKTKLDFLGKNLDELIKKNTWVNTRHPDDRKKFIKLLDDSANKKKGFSTEIRIIDKNGKYRWVLDSASPRLTQDGTFVGLIGSGMDITDSINYRKQIEISLKEKELLMREVHHRVKNNLQIISSLLNVQMSYLTNENAITLFKSTQDRVKSMAMLHEKLYFTNDLTKIDIRDYIKRLAHELLRTYSLSDKIVLKTKIEPSLIDLDFAVHIGLILNELISNCLKHGFKNIDKKGEIVIKMKQIPKGKLEILVSDNRAGLPEDFDMSANNSFGLELINTLKEQYNGSLEITKKGRTEFKIILDIPNNNS